MIASRVLCRLIVVATLGATGFVRAAEAATPALVVDVDSGKVLYAERATDPWFPASITKLMTAYVALDLVRSGKASMDQLLTVSAEAASQPPSKMGFKPGIQLTLDNALKIIMVKSANDIAATIAENLGGSIEGFAALMNETAGRLGMQESRWFNPHGLPDDRQQTSARDMAILGRALLRDFPDNRDLFSISAIQFGRRVMANHNGLIGRYPGADGMKTGFICSGGFNVVASATQNGRRLITVVMGSTNAKERTLKAADLFDRGFAASGWGGQSLQELPASNLIAPPNMRSLICERRGPVPAEEDAQPALVQGSQSGNADNGSMFASMAAASAQRRALGPRAPLQPVLVWLGRDPAGASVLAEGEEGAVPAGRKGARRLAAKAQPEGAAEGEPKPKALARAKLGAIPSAAQAFTSAETPSILEEGRGGNKGAINPGAALEPKPKLGALGSAGEPRAKAGAIAPKKAVAAVRNPPSEPTASAEPVAPIKRAHKVVKKLAAKPDSPTKPEGLAAAKPKAKPQAGPKQEAKVASKPKPSPKLKTKAEE
jgi:D-alanyl-D-alanine carboxypeptidase